MAIKIARNNDPFKKYWWVILAGFGIVGAWICLPLLGSNTGAAGVSGEGSLSKSADQSLDSAANPSGAPGAAVDLSMDGTGPYKKHEGPAMSSLYSAPGSASVVASTNTLAMAKANVGLADKLKAVARKSASADPSGWGGEKAQSGFAAPHGSFGSLSGLPGGSGSGASMASSGGGGGGGFFGSGVANVGVTAAQGLKGSADEDKTPQTGMKSLNQAASSSFLAAKSGSFDASSALSGQAFDGRGSGGSISGGAAAGGAGMSYGALDAAPVNLKDTDPFANKNVSLNPVPGVDAGGNTDQNAQMKQEVMMMVGMMVIGGLCGASMSSMMPMIGMMAMQMAMQSQQGQSIQQGAGVHSSIP